VLKRILLFKQLLAFIGTGIHYSTTAGNYGRSYWSAILSHLYKHLSSTSISTAVFGNLVVGLNGCSNFARNGTTRYWLSWNLMFLNSSQEWLGSSAAGIGNTTNHELLADSWIIDGVTTSHHIQGTYEHPSGKMRIH